jgi:hypothetical protein
VRLDPTVVPPVDAAQLVEVLSSTVMSAQDPVAIAIAFVPETPAPSTTTSAGETPVTPPRSRPRPPWARISACAPTWGAKQPATSLIG